MNNLSVSNSSSTISHSGLDMTWVITPASVYGCLACVILSSSVTFYEIWRHVTQYDYPRLQLHIVRILLMIPFYGWLSFAALWLHHWRFFLDTIRDTYESFVLYTFFVLLVEYCGGEAELVQSLVNKKYKGVHPVPLCWLPLFRLNGDFLLRCKRYVLQYALIKPFLSALACMTAPFHLYEEANFDWGGNIYPWVFLIGNASITYSLYYLVLFHLETEKELRYCKPTWKFICIKSIIFFAFWQAASVSVLIALGWVYTGRGEGGEEAERVNGAIQDVLMCIELVPVSLMHFFAFGRGKLEEEMDEQPMYQTCGIGGQQAGAISLSLGGGVESKKTKKQKKEMAKHNFDRALDLRDFVKDTIATIFYRQGMLVGGSGGGEGGVENGEYPEGEQSPTTAGNEIVTTSASYPPSSTSYPLAGTNTIIHYTQKRKRPATWGGGENANGCTAIEQEELRLLSLNRNCFQSVAVMKAMGGASSSSISLSSTNKNGTTSSASSRFATHTDKSASVITPTFLSGSASPISQQQKLAQYQQSLQQHEMEQQQRMLQLFLDFPSSSSSSSSAFNDGEEKEEEEGAREFAEQNGDLDNGEIALRPNRQKNMEAECNRVALNDKEEGGFSAGPAVYCNVCGRFDRQMIKRKSGYKCVQCVGRKSKRFLRRKQEEVHAEDNDMSCVVCGRKDRVMVQRGTGLRCVKCL